MLTVPRTRGSSTKLRFSICPIALATASMSALTKFSVTRSSCCAAAAPASSALSSAHSAKRRRLAARTALQRQALDRAVVTEQHVVGVHFAQHEAADALADRGAARLAAFEREDRAPAVVRRAGRDHADQADLARGNAARCAGAEQVRLDRGHAAARVRAIHGCGRGERARRQRDPGPVRENRGENADERKLKQQNPPSSLEPVLQPAVHLYSVSRSKYPAGIRCTALRAGADSRSSKSWWW